MQLPLDGIGVPLGEGRQGVLLQQRPQPVVVRVPLAAVHCQVLLQKQKGAHAVERHWVCVESCALQGTTVWDNRRLGERAAIAALCLLAMANSV